HFQGLVDLLEDEARLRNGIVQGPSHADRLRTLTGKDKSLHHVPEIPGGERTLIAPRRALSSGLALRPFSCIVRARFGPLGRSAVSARPEGEDAPWTRPRRLRGVCLPQCVVTSIRSSRVRTCRRSRPRPWPKPIPTCSPSTAAR